METKTFNVLFKRYEIEGTHFKAFSGQVAPGYEEPDWDMCPEIDGCPVADFLEKAWDKNGEPVQEFKMTLTKKEKK